MAPKEAKLLSWPDLDSIYEGYERSQQRALVGPRLLALQTYNVNVEEKHRIQDPADYLYLDKVDKPRIPKTHNVSAAHQAFLERRKKAGKSIEFESV